MEEGGRGKGLRGRYERLGVRKREREKKRNRWRMRKRDRKNDCVATSSDRTACRFFILLLDVSSMAMKEAELRWA